MPTSLRWGEVASLIIIPGGKYTVKPVNGGCREGFFPDRLSHEGNSGIGYRFLGLTVKVSPKGDFVTLIRGNEFNQEGKRFKVVDSHSDGKRVVRISIRTGRRDLFFNDEVLEATFEIVKPKKGEHVIDGSEFNKGGSNPSNVDPLPWRGTLSRQ
ncbi:MAG: hypothetical protein BWY24_00176 [Microgenomates group bacterium ADurb.Bin219]|nr:MAG: hypothetical protein BWY24_00176 [Microgenomates group bacterium ADurb.Bin219]HNP89005.1 hypothetical protein [Candidatus Woesebacteria bacterium]